MRKLLRACVLVLIAAYAAVVLAWCILHNIAGDSIWWLFLVNTLAFYLFVPPPLVALLALVSRSRLAWGAIAGVFALDAYLFGDLFGPKVGLGAATIVPASSTGLTLRVMTFNLLGYYGIGWLLQEAPEVVPILRDATFRRAWVGLRPVSADGVPLLGALPGWSGVSVATGHGAYGVLLSPITGKLMAQVVCGEPTDLSMTPYDLARFGNKPGAVPIVPVYPRFA